MVTGSGSYHSASLFPQTGIYRGVWVGLFLTLTLKLGINEWIISPPVRHLIPCTNMYKITCWENAKCNAHCSL